jgi:hypothetical protein
MFKRSNTSPTTHKKKVGTNKFVLGFAALAATAVVSTTGVGLAATQNDKPSKSQCASAGFSNYGQCVKEWAHNKNKPGNGYGGGNNSVNVDVEVNGDNNIIQVIINLFS